MLNLSFINAYFLYGLLLVGAPVIIHLVNKKKAVTLDFPTIRFVLESKKRVAKRFKLRQILLLILRTLAVLFLVFLFARPLLSSQKEEMDYANTPRSAVIIVDNSFSMLYKSTGRSFFDSSVASAKSLITGLKNIDNAALLSTCDIDDQAVRKLTYKKDELLDSLKNVKIRYTRNNILKSIAGAVEMLKPSKNPVKEIFFVSDMQRFGWDDDSVWPEGLKKTVKENGISVYLVDIAHKNVVRNIGVTNVSVMKEGKGKVGVLNIFSSIRNFSRETFEDILIKCFIAGDEIVKGFVTLKSSEEGEKSFYAPIDESGIITGYVTLRGDGFAPDDIRYFSLKSFRTVRTLVVDGDPTTQIYKSETFYLDLGLNPLKDAYSKIESRIVTFEEFKKEELANYDAVLLCNVETMPPARLHELRKFVKDGGGLVFFLGDKVDPQKYNETFGDLLPQKLRDVYTETAEGSEKPFEYIDVKDYSHPMLSPFEGADNGDLGTAKFYKYFVLQPSTESKSNIVLEFSNGNPCIVEKDYFNGNILMFTSSADRDFNDLCIYPTYLPLMQQMTLYAAKALGREAYTELTVGDAAEFPVDKTIEHVTVVDPDGELFYEKTNMLKEIARVKFEKTKLPGFYNVYEGKISGEQVKSAETIDTFAINVDTKESDFTRITDKELKILFADRYSFIEGGGDVGEVKLRYLKGEEIWNSLLLLLIVFLLFESIIASTWRKRKEIKSAKWKEEGLRHI